MSFDFTFVYGLGQKPMEIGALAPNNKKEEKEEEIIMEFGFNQNKKYKRVNTNGTQQKNFLIGGKLYER